MLRILYCLNWQISLILVPLSAVLPLSSGIPQFLQNDSWWISFNHWMNCHLPVWANIRLSLGQSVHSNVYLSFIHQKCRLWLPGIINIIQWYWIWGNPIYSQTASLFTNNTAFRFFALALQTNSSLHCAMGILRIRSNEKPGFLTFWNTE